MERRGIIKFSKRLMCEEQMADILGLLRFVPFHVQPELDTVSMFGVSPLFDEVKDELTTPEYIVTITREKADGHISLNLERLAWT